MVDLHSLSSSAFALDAVYVFLLSAALAKRWLKKKAKERDRSDITFYCQPVNAISGLNASTIHTHTHHWLRRQRCDCDVKSRAVTNLAGAYVIYCHDFAALLEEFPYSSKHFSH